MTTLSRLHISAAMRHAMTAVAVMAGCTGLRAEDYSCTSPDGNIRATVSMTGGRLTYTVTKAGRTIVDESPLGLRTAAADLTEGLSFVSTATAEVDDPYWLPVGKQTSYRDRCNILSVITGKGNWRQTVQFRLYDDGFAYRYVIPKYGGNTTTTLTGDAGRIRVSGFDYALACRFTGSIQGTNYAYEAAYDRYTTWNALRSTGDGRYNSPTLVHAADGYMLLSEADNRGTFCTSLIKAEAGEGEFSYAWTGEKKDYGEDKQHDILCTLPAYTPWRMAVTGDLPTVFGTTMAENLCPPTAMTDMDWIRPGRVAWYWGGSDGNKGEIQREYGGLKNGELAHADLAADMGWEYTLIDGGWQSGWIPEVVEHANSRGVECLLWQTATLRDCQDFSNDNMDATLDKWRKWGIKGIKVDFWEDDSKETMYRMEHLLQTAAKHRMLVNLHGCTRPSGLRRTYPHLMTQEGIYGGENNFWAAKNISATHHINLVMTRNVVGAADYTPGDFATWYGNIITQESMGHHMALLTAFESGLVHIAENPENLRHFIGRDIMMRLPVAWDETRLLEGEVQRYATIARRNGNDWWIAGINSEARTCRLTFDFLDEGKTYTAYIYRDGNCRSDLRFSKMEVTRGQSVNIKQLSEGGFLMQVSPDGNLPVPAERKTYEAESATITGGGRRTAYDGLHASGGWYVTYIGLGNKLQFDNISADTDGDYLLTIYSSTADTRHARLVVNGEQAGDTLTFHSNRDITGTFDPVGMAWKTIPVRLRAGNANTIELQSYDDLWAPNFDRITIHRLSPDADAIPSAQAGLQADGTEALYDLAGRRLTAAPDHGVYVKGGRKYLSAGRL